MKTIDTIRDEIAGMMGWVRRQQIIPDAKGVPTERGLTWARATWPLDYQSSGHPIPPTLDGIAAMMPGDYRVNILQYTDGWYAHARHKQVSPGKIAHKAEQYPTELEARTRLLHAVLTATKGATHEK